MSGKYKQPRFSLHSPTNVNITIVGYLDDSWSERLGLSLTQNTINEDKAVKLAQPGGFIRVLVDLGPQMAHLLTALKARGTTAY
jgi:hypothetical protein